MRLFLQREAKPEDPIFRNPLDDAAALRLTGEILSALWSLEYGLRPVSPKLPDGVQAIGMVNSTALLGTLLFRGGIFVKPQG